MMSSATTKPAGDGSRSTATSAAPPSSVNSTVPATSASAAEDAYKFVGSAPPPDMKQRELIFDSLQKVVTVPYRTTDKATKGTYAFAWGAGYMGQLGHRFNRLQRRYSNVPVPVHLPEVDASGLTIRQVACGFNHSAMVTDGGHIYTWGENSDKQLGHVEDKNTPQKVPRPQNTFFVQVACGHAHTVAVCDNGLVYAWGQNKYGQLGNLEVQVAAEPILIQSELVRDVVMAACGSRHTILLTKSGTVISFGSSEHGQTGHGDRHAAAVAAAAAAEAKAAAQAGSNSTNGATGAFGSTSQASQASGNGSRNNSLTTTLPSSGGHVTVAAAAAAAAAAARRNASPASGTSADRTPKIIEALRGINIVHIACGPMHSCFVSAEGHVYVCGFGEFLMPDEDQHFFTTPKRVPFPADVKITQVACGLGHILALASTGAVYAWGTSKYGEVGHGIAVDGCPAPRLVLDRSDIHQVAAGRYHSMALSKFGVLWSWGCHENGQLGHEGKENECVKLPKVVRSILGMVVGHVACGENHSLAMTSAPWARPAADVERLYREAEHEFDVKGELVQAGGQFKGLIKKDRRVLKDKMDEWVQKEAAMEASEQRKDQEALERDLSEIKYTGSLQATVLKRVKALGEVVDQTGGQVFVAPSNDANATSNVAGQLTYNGATSAASARGTGFTNAQSRGGIPTAGALTSRRDAKASTSTTGVVNGSPSVTYGEDGPRELDAVMALHPALRPHAPGESSGANSDAPGSQTYVLANPYAPMPTGPRGTSPMYDYSGSQGSGAPGSAGMFPKSLSSAELLNLPAIRRGAGRNGQPAPNTHRGLPSRDAQQLAKTIPSGQQQQVDPTKNALMMLNDPSNQIMSLSAYSQASHQMRADFLKASAQMVKQMTSVVQNTGEEAQNREMRRLLNRLLDLRREYDQAKEEAKRREQQLYALNQEIERRTQQQGALQDSQKSIDQRVSILRMRLKTMTIKISETQDNRANYETNIIKMKEEDYDNEKTIFDIRQAIQDLSHRTRKYVEAKEAAIHDKLATHKELHEFQGEIAEYEKFIKAQFAQFNDIIKVVQTQKEKREKAKAAKVSETQRRVEEKRDKLRAEAQLTENDRLALAARLNSHELKLRIFENTFAQLTEATGLNDPDEIVKKFFFKAEIHDQLRRDIAQREEQITKLRQEEEELKHQLATAMANYRHRTWKDVEALSEALREAEHRSESVQKDVEVASQRIALVQEGLVSLVRLLLNNEVSLGSNSSSSSTSSGRGRANPPNADARLDLAQVEQLLERDPLELWRSELADQIFDRIMRDLDVLCEAEKDNQIRMQNANQNDSTEEIRKRLGTSPALTTNTLTTLKESQPFQNLLTTAAPGSPSASAGHQDHPVDGGSVSTEATPQHGTDNLGTNTNAVVATNG